MQSPCVWGSVPTPALPCPAPRPPRHAPSSLPPKPKHISPFHRRIIAQNTHRLLLENYLLSLAPSFFHFAPRRQHNQHFVQTFTLPYTYPLTHARPFLRPKPPVNHAIDQQTKLIAFTASPDKELLVRVLCQYLTPHRRHHPAPSEWRFSTRPHDRTFSRVRTTIFSSTTIAPPWYQR